MRKKLIELLAEQCEWNLKRCIGCKENLSVSEECKEERFGHVADYLIENGVTLIGWIPSSELPKEKGWYWVYVPKYYGGSSSGKETVNGIAFAKWSGKSWSIETGYHKRPGCVTHWMPLPEPPKEERDDA